MRERTPFNAEVFEGLPNLELFVTSGMRNASVDIAAAEKQGVIVCGTDGSFQATPEHTWSLLLACARNIHQDSNALTDGKWQTQLGIELYGKTIGLLGIRQNRRQSCRICAGLWHENNSLESKFNTGALRRSWSWTSFKRRTFQEFRLCEHSSSVG